MRCAEPRSNSLSTRTVMGICEIDSGETDKDQIVAKQK